jgi:hypothetical protein
LVEAAPPMTKVTHSCFPVWHSGFSAAMKPPSQQALAAEARDTIFSAALLSARGSVSGVLRKLSPAKNKKYADEATIGV